MSSTTHLQALLKAKLAAAQAKGGVLAAPAQVATTQVAHVSSSPATLTPLQQLQAKLGAAHKTTAPMPAAANDLPAATTVGAATVLPPVSGLSALQQLALITKSVQQAPSQTGTAHLAPAIPTALPAIPQGTGTARTGITWNEQQLAGINLARSGKSFCLIGSAGTGKTTTEREIVRVMSEALREELGADPHKFEPSNYIVVCAFTRRAVRNTHKALSVLGDKYTACCKTVHKALKYSPVFTEELNDEGEFIKRKRFEPLVTKNDPDKNVRIILVDEASMLGYNGLYRQLYEGFPNAIFIFIGDLNQLRPVMDDPTLAYALACLPVVELTEVYRQALDSPIVEFQYTFTLQGKVPNKQQLMAYNKEKRGLHFQAFSWAKLQDQSKYNTLFVQNFIAPSFKAGTYKPDDSVILIPYNKAGTFGAVELNIEIAEFLGQQRDATVFEVIAGYHKKYLAVGDYVLFERRECEIVDIAFNSGYHGVETMQPSSSLSRHGYYISANSDQDHDLFAGNGSVLDAAKLLEQLMEAPEEEEKDSSVRSASHTITVKDRETGEVDTLSVNKDILDLEFSYAMTAHKSQGSEWRKVYVILHECHRNASRELLYTGMTRAREELVVFYSQGNSTGMNLDNSSLARAINRQEIAGKTWKEKAAAYKLKMNNGDADAPMHMNNWPSMNETEEATLSE